MCSPTFMAFGERLQPLGGPVKESSGVLLCRGADVCLAEWGVVIRELGSEMEITIAQESISKM